MKLGILGGTFDPPHLGHLIVAQDAWTMLNLDRVLFLPAALPPHKLDSSISPAELRLDMVRAAIAGDDRFAVSELELRRAGPSFTVDTLRELGRLFPDAELFLLVGADQVREFHLWREPAEIAQRATVVAMSRAGELVAPDPAFPASVLPVTRIDVSATGVRARIAAGQPIRYMVPPGVEAIIRRERLYGPAAGEAAAGTGSADAAAG